MNIIYVSDFNCPYSYIGLERLKTAINNLDLDVIWEMKSFELEPHLKDEFATTVTERYAIKYGISLDDARSRIAEIEKIASQDGLDINYKGLKLTSSKNAHRLIKFAQTKDLKMAHELAEKIFYANFIENENIADKDVLTKLAVSCGMDKEDVITLLESNTYEIEVALDQDEAISHGITATPCYILNLKGERLIMPGVFPLEEFEIALKDLSTGNLSKKTFL